MTHKKEILVVDDNLLNREMLVAILEDDYKVLQAENGIEALDILSKDNDVALILLDVMMPIMDGYEATRCIRALENSDLAKVPIFAMTANAFDEDRKAAIECGMNGFLSKPIDIEELIRTLQNIFGLK